MYNQFYCVLKLMKEKHSFLSPQANKHDHHDSTFNFKKSPTKFAVIDPYKQAKDHLKNSPNQNQTFTYNNLEHVKKISNEYSHLRQTMYFRTLDYSQWRE